MRRRVLGAACVALALVLGACEAGGPAPVGGPSGSVVASGSASHWASASASSSASQRPAPGSPPPPASVVAGPESLGPVPAPSRAVQPAPMARTRQLNQAASYCIDRDVPAEPASDVVLTVLDRTHMLPRGYAPGDLVGASAAGFGGAQGSKLVRGLIIDDLAALRRDSAAAGLTIQLQSTYRSYASQVSTFNHWVSVYGLAGALVRSARPGHSEHQLGTTIDFTSPGWGGRFGNWANETREGAWLAANGWRYGFVMSYPLGTQATTCFSYEPWHYRWIGRSQAAAWRASGLTLHEFLDSLG
ncbi:MAG TPA: M15 family metallopeptidase [Candidatus Limnocylindria bacterium]|nr:M15 family metallopeptidase [Candidatus Limnocylindria bacterium]